MAAKNGSRTETNGFKNNPIFSDPPHKRPKGGFMAQSSRKLVFLLIGFEIFFIFLFAFFGKYSQDATPAPLEHPEIVENSTGAPNHFEHFSELGGDQKNNSLPHFYPGKRG